MNRFVSKILGSRFQSTRIIKYSLDRNASFSLINHIGAQNRFTATVSKQQAFKELEKVPIEGVDKDLQKTFYDFMDDTVIVGEQNKLPRRSLLTTFLQRTKNEKEMDLALVMWARWRLLGLLPLSEKTTWVLLSRCQFLKYPDPLITVLLDRYKYKAFPTWYIFEQTAKLISARISSIVSEQGQDSDAANKYLDDLFRLFAAVPYYDLELEDWAYSFLILGCIKCGMEEGFTRVIEVATEALELSANTGVSSIDFEAATALVDEFTKRGDAENAKIYFDYIQKYNLKPSPSYHVSFDEDGKMSYQEFQPKDSDIKN
ncbi:hypothetical protein AYI68_g8031 [Smittium mucronatum]|uniref:Uncharacterized protein n=1 Tax=Smittium mucronatum TaxID=133383 RepID=A0A1R0GM32_9FUNG|nr:hypothetical protein AYI68_g8031 [Smittium mucronatum]